MQQILALRHRFGRVHNYPRHKALVFMILSGRKANRPGFRTSAADAASVARVRCGTGLRVLLRAGALRRRGAWGPSPAARRW